MPIGPAWTEPNVWDPLEEMTEALADSNLTDNPNHLKQIPDQAKINDDGTSHTVGECVIIDTTKANHVERTTSASHAGPVLVALGTVAAAATGYYRLQGVASVKVDGTCTTIGQSLATSTTGGTATVSVTNPFAVSLEAPSGGFVVAWVHNRGSAGSLTAHDHDTSGNGGLLTNDRHDGYSVYDEIAAPAAPDANTLRLYAKDKSTVTELFYKNSAGTERDLSGVADHDHTGDAGDGGSLSATYALDTDFDAHTANTAAHGASGAVVGTTNTQTLSNKTLAAPTITDFTNAAHDHGDANDGAGLVLAALPITSLYPAFYAYQSGSQQSINDQTFTKVRLDTETAGYDHLANFDSTTNYRFTATVAGLYLFIGHAFVEALGDGKRGVLALYKNGSEIDLLADLTIGAANNVLLSGASPLKLDVAEYVELYVWHNHGAARNLLNSSAWYTSLKSILLTKD